MYRNFLFDFDGTIIDSYPGVQGAFDNAYKTIFGIEGGVDISKNLGDTLPQMVKNVIGDVGEEKINAFIASFKETYDNSQFANSILYPGIVETLETLQKNNAQLFLVTNKRAIPTKKILGHLDLGRFFGNKVYCSNSIEPPFPHKYLLVEQLIQKYSLIATQTVYIGDTINDKVTAEKNNISFIFAAYGYEQLTDCTNIAETPIDIIKYFK